MRLALLLLVLLPVTATRAETCKYVDADGRVIYSNAPVKGARKVQCFQPPSAPTPPPPEPAQGEQAPAGASSEGGAGRSKVDEQTQRRRDDSRRSILEQELAAEQEALDAAKRALSEQEAVRYGDERNYQRVLDRVKPYQDAVELHEKNIASIKQELANLR